MPEIEQAPEAVTRYTVPGTESAVFTQELTVFSCVRFSALTESGQRPAGGSPRAGNRELRALGDTARAYVTQRYKGRAWFCVAQ
ncbi:hypothetical protein AAFF_G00267350 [Aldrovandia affinis]|uniref:Uncharacterized protein n=1 Tax=Aldrovandia affinis TaxID=143900 RepID=A0AAD7RB50_9TELE|nr:hypothetical protein AAFF_G00267350 [Aldrovandia affinis]